MIVRISDLADSFLAADGLQITVVLGLLVFVLYFRKLLGLGSILSTWARMAMFSAVVLMLLVITGIVPHLDLGAGRSLVDRGTEIAATLIEVIRT